ncbi:hypothetical protein BKA70DRAFT_1397513 [Coprinopsis sp. MPI-PUGE-AT-0042]|nr:hypothetical protein BKA70DRAFT_1397513 [Coprinopsis sp. MPI-PUGE-AT-0042]
MCPLAKNTLCLMCLPFLVVVRLVGARLTPGRHLGEGLSRVQTVLILLRTILPNPGRAAALSYVHDIYFKATLQQGIHGLRSVLAGTSIMAARGERVETNIFDIPSHIARSPSKVSAPVDRSCRLGTDRRPTLERIEFQGNNWGVQGLQNWSSQAIHLTFGLLTQCARARLRNSRGEGASTFHHTTRQVLCNTAPDIRRSGHPDVLESRRICQNLDLYTVVPMLKTFPMWPPATPALLPSTGTVAALSQPVLAFPVPDACGHRLKPSPTELLCRIRHENKDRIPEGCSMVLPFAAALFKERMETCRLQGIIKAYEVRVQSLEKAIANLRKQHLESCTIVMQKIMPTCSAPASKLLTLFGLLGFGSTETNSPLIGHFLAYERELIPSGSDVLRISIHCLHQPTPRVVDPAYAGSDTKLRVSTIYNIESGEQVCMCGCCTIRVTTAGTQNLGNGPGSIAHSSSPSYRNLYPKRDWVPGLMRADLSISFLQLLLPRSQLPIPFSTRRKQSHKGLTVKVIEAPKSKPSSPMPKNVSIRNRIHCPFELLYRIVDEVYTGPWDVLEIRDCLKSLSRTCHSLFKYCRSLIFKRVSLYADGSSEYKVRPRVDFPSEHGTIQSFTRLIKWRPSVLFRVKDLTLTMRHPNYRENDPQTHVPFPHEDWSTLFHILQLSNDFASSITRFAFDFVPGQCRPDGRVSGEILLPLFQCLVQLPNLESFTLKTWGCGMLIPDMLLFVPSNVQELALIFFGRKPIFLPSSHQPASDRAKAQGLDHLPTEMQHLPLARPWVTNLKHLQLGDCNGGTPEKLRVSLQSSFATLQCLHIEMPQRGHQLGFGLETLPALRCLELADSSDDGTAMPGRQARQGMEVLSELASKSSLARPQRIRFSLLGISRPCFDHEWGPEDIVGAQNQCSEVWHEIGLKQNTWRNLELVAVFAYINWEVGDHREIWDIVSVGRYRNGASQLIVEGNLEQEYQSLWEGGPCSGWRCARSTGKAFTWM